MDRLNGSDLAAMFTAAAAALERNVEAINALNVFPVPDGDTGTNMYLTMQSGIDDLSAIDEAPTASDAASAVYSGTFMGARGNSGVILSQFFKGFKEGLEGNVDCTPEDFARACSLARHNAYQSVANPVEGTMLTVITSIAEAAREAVDEEADIQTTLRTASARAHETVAKTTSMLPVLQEAGVVDAGGQGLAVVIEGFRRNVAGEDANAEGYDIQVPEGGLSGSFRVSDEFLSAHEGDAYGYCTQFVVEAEGLDVDDLRDLMNGIAESTVVIGDGSRAMVHGHAEDPGRLVSVGVSAGSISKVKIENMDVQHSEFSSNLTTQGATTDANASVVTVAWGDGIARVFRELGAAHMVTGGNTMNPSVRDLLTAVDRSPADNVYLLPNNKNIIPTAKQVPSGQARTFMSWRLSLFPKESPHCSASIPMLCKKKTSIAWKRPKVKSRQGRSRRLCGIRPWTVFQCERGSTSGCLMAGFSPQAMVYKKRFLISSAKQKSQTPLTSDSTEEGWYQSPMQTSVWKRSKTCMMLWK